MKKFVVFLLLTAFVGIVHAQNNKCNTPIPYQQFLQKYNQIKSKPNDVSRLQLAKYIVKSFCFSSDQIKEIATLFENDNNRLEFAKAAYANTTDKENFYDVYDAFVYYSNVFRLHDFINNKNIPGQDDQTTIQIDFPNYKYPSYKLYKGKRNCPQACPIDKFNTIVNEVYSLSDNQQRYYKAISLINNTCLPTEQLMKLSSLVTSEELKLSFAKKAFQIVYDIDNYIEMKQIFNTPRARSEFINFLSSQSTDNSNNVTSRITNCSVSDSEYQMIINSLKNEKFNTNKVNSAKQLIQTNKCFTAIQIKGIVELFNYENSKLEIAKYGYDYAINKSEYYVQVSEALGFESSKQKLLDYIKSKSR